MSSDHGLLAAANTVEVAVFYSISLEKLCHFQLATCDGVLTGETVDACNKCCLLRILS
jgi:ribulose-5-phosphate 4-epimerase/fuculose-1-phosphate aldolase